jgi:hypothetical protein
MALTVGILRALQRQTEVKRHAAFVEYLESLQRLLLREDILKKIHKAANMVECSSGSMPSYPEQSHDSILLGVHIFRVIEAFLVFGAESHEDEIIEKGPWEYLLANHIKFRKHVQMEPYLIEFAKTVFKYLWNTSWPFDESTEGIYVLQSMTMKCSAICCLYVPDLNGDFISNAIAFLEDVELNADLSTLITVIEALQIVAVNSKAVSSLILDTFVKMLSKPSHLFLRVAERRFYIGLRETLSRSVVKCLRAFRDPNLTKSILFTFLKFFTASQKSSSPELLNAMSLISNVTRLLDSQEVLRYFDNL